ncbi:MAG: tetratricopeptide repeat protein [Fimbriimonadales bacterium]|nr:tetratricopeptide repeat protein [Fimbriimonadales bacterium]MCS7190106.1 tetratricopeptide repeat protein [Fimbriimonadales bacterium]
MAQQDPIDQRKLFTQTLVISMIIWLLVLLGWSYFSRPPVSDKQPEQIVAEVAQLRAEKDYVEATRRAQELATRYRGTEYGALGILLEAEIFYKDKQDAREAYNRLRQLEELYPNTKVYREQGLPLLEQVARKIDEEMGQLPSYRTLDAIMRLFSFAGDARFILGIFFIAAVVRLIQVPLVNRQFASMRKMLQLQPKLLELQQKYTGQELVQRQMALYKKYGVNPMSGCLYALLPIPFLILVYNAFLVYQVQFRAGHFLWINPSAAAQFPGLVGAHLGQFDAPLTLLYAASMYLTSRLTITDPSQAQMQKTMALFTTLMLLVISWQFRFPAAFIMYWLLTNVFYTIHYKLYMRTPAPELTPVDGSDSQESRNGATEKPKPTGYQPPKKRSKRK